jgi:uncharacterized repeat protein (TIGR03803 family)
MLQASPRTDSSCRAWRRLSSLTISLIMILGTMSIAARPAQSQTYKVLHSFNGKDGSTPSAGLMRDTTVNLYGTTALGGKVEAGLVFKLNAAGRETVLHYFGSGDGVEPLAGLIQGANGDLYGTTMNGGSAGFGTVFGLDPSGREILLYSFGGSPEDGAFPSGGLVEDRAGNLYGTTSLGGTSGDGVVFELGKNGVETVLYNFSGPDGAGPQAGLILDNEGNLFGTTEVGGKYSKGNVFELSGTDETVLFTFTGHNNGSEPVDTLVEDAAGNLYGTTRLGGKSGAGTVFKIDRTGKETVLYSFNGLSDGSQPMAGLVRDSKGNLYGTTQLGGNEKQGIVFELSPSSGGKWRENVLHTFSGKDGGQPLVGLIQDGNGNLYGTASVGGQYHYGLVFKITR